MTLNRPAALAIAGLGLALAIAGPLLPGGERLTRESPPEVGHITALTVAEDGALLTGTQDGALWRRAGGTWARLPVNSGGQPVTALGADTGAAPARGPIGTGDGLINPPPGLPDVGARIADVVSTGIGLVIATGDGVLVQGAGAWRAALTGVNVYRLQPQSLDGTGWLHAGSIGQGVFAARDAALTDWQPNSAGLHAQANGFAFAVTAAGRLLLGSDRGLYWQGAPLAPWHPLKIGLDGARILALHLARPAADGTQRLWLGTDTGLYWVALRESADQVAATAYATRIDAPAGETFPGIGWIVPDGDGVMFSAGALWRYGPAGLAGWYWVSLAGLVLILLGGWLLPARGESPADLD